METVFGAAVRDTLMGQWASAAPGGGWSAEEAVRNLVAGRRFDLAQLPEDVDVPLHKSFDNAVAAAHRAAESIPPRTEL